MQTKRVSIRTSVLSVAIANVSLEQSSVRFSKPRISIIPVLHEIAMPVHSDLVPMRFLSTSAQVGWRLASCACVTAVVACGHGRAFSFPVTSNRVWS